VLTEFAGRRSSAPRSTDAVVETLTGREVDILRLLCEGLSNQEIAARLFIEPSTVKYHLAGLLGKIGARDRLQAVVWAFRNGLDGG
jgi:DNA-binding NarL/FixJ family response regulator